MLSSVRVAQCVLYIFTNIFYFSLRRLLPKRHKIGVFLKTTGDISFKPSPKVITFHFAQKTFRGECSRPTVSEIAKFRSIFNALFDRVKTKFRRVWKRHKLCLGMNSKTCNFYLNPPPRVGIVPLSVVQWAREKSGRTKSVVKPLGMDAVSGINVLLVKFNFCFILN